ncbi:MAG: ATP-dependent zinc metalloprotease FtsH, partial [Actinomycetota bacterium]|nr:ATP-dependent zinc metalloprotease FtsH [Actinomycetota bacterium]
MDFKRLTRKPLFYVILAVLGFVVLASTFSAEDPGAQVDTSAVLQALEADKVARAEINDNDQRIEIALNDGTRQHAFFLADAGDRLVAALDGSGVDYEVTPGGSGLLASLLISLLPLLLIMLLLFFFLSQMQGGGGRVMQFGKSRAKLVAKDTPKTTFSDVAGADEAIQELQEIKEFLQNPAKFQAIGAKIPKGVLLYGPPGTGKTLLARAVAGEAGVPFYSISGSDFVEMFVGVGASRVRDLFEQAKNNAPAIIFVDEIDAVGRQRGAGLGGGHDEREQTLNQMLVEMDGFDVKGGVILIAATNRPDILDPALLRPGRFDRQIVVDRPDLLGRKAVLEVHTKGKPIDPSVDLEVIARRTPGFTGADLANVVNEGALLAARKDLTTITTTLLEEAIDRVMAGPERKTRAMSDKEKKVIAYHEGGHALVAHALPNNDPVHKITILPRGRALGYTMTLPVEDKYLASRSEMIDQLAMMLGGRTAEELVFHEPTTGASNDIEKATHLARAMVTEYGMSERLGARKFGTSDSQPFLGREMGHQRDYSEEVAQAIDSEIRRLIEAAHDEAWEILVEYRDVLDELVLRLMDKETLEKSEVLEVFAPVVKRPTRGSYTGHGKRLPSDLPPVMTPSELARLGPEDVAGLVSSANGSGTNGSGTNGSGGANGSGRANGSAGVNGSGRMTGPAGANGSGASRTAAAPRVPSGAPASAPEPPTPG